MGFCGTKADAMSVKDGVLQNECFVDVLNIIPHATLALIGIFIVTVWNHSVMGKLKAKTWVHFQGHNFRWILTLILLFIIIIEIAEGVISDANDPDTTNYHAFVPQCLSFFGALIGIIYYHKVEIWNSPKFLLALLVYWPAATSLKFLKVFSMYKNNITMEHLKMWLAWIVIALYIALSIVEMNLLRLQKYAFFKRSCRLKPPKDLEKTRYIQSYVNLLSKALFWWVTDILILGYKRPLSLSDLGELPKRECAVKHYKKLQLIFEEEKQRAAQNKREPSLTKSYLKAFWKLMLLGALYRLLGDLLAFVGPVCIEYIVNYAYDVKQNKSYANVTMRRHPLVTVDQFFWNGYTLSVVLFFASILQNTFLQNHHFLVVREGVRLRSAVQGMVYSKVLRLSTLALNNGLLTVGQIMNNMSVDATFLMYFFYFVHYIWAVPVQVSITLAILYIKLGISALIGGLFVVVCAPIMYFLGVWMSRMQKKVLVQSDKRVKKVNEVIQGIRVVKLLAWEEAFVNGVETSRTEEIRCLIPHACLKGLMGVIGMAAPVVGAMLTFVLHPLLTDEPLTAGVALSILALFNLLSGPLQLLTLVSAAVANARVSARRLQPLLMAPEVPRRSSPSMPSRRCTSAIQPDPMSEQSNQDKFDTVVNIDGDRGSPETLPLRANFNHGDNDSCRSSSIVSCSSVGITAKSHSRQNSGDSLLDVFENRPSSLTRNATSSELLDVKPLTLMRKSSAPVLSTSEGIEYKRRRHHSGVSTGDIEDVTEDMVFLELRNAVEISSGNFSWRLDTKELTLKNISMKIPMAKLTMVVGQVGAGKSSLLAAILGEMVKVSGSVDWASDVSVAYVSQSPWLLNASLRENILFGSSYVWRKYKKVITACALQPDIDQLPSGDLTEIGEKGLTLSGGQKQRVALARALYSNADVVILDDPLASLDPHVGRQVFEEAIMKRMVRRKKTVVMVTHHVQYLSHAGQVLVMADGTVYYQGKVGDVKKFDPDLYESWRKAIKDARATEHRIDSGDHLMVERKHSSGSNMGHDPLVRPPSVQSQLSVPGLPINARKMSQMSHMSVMTEASNEELAEQEDEETKDETDGVGEKGQMVKQEHKETGAVAFSVYLRYIRACSVPLCIISIILQIIYHSILVFSNFWLAQWSNYSDAAARRKSQPSPHPVNLVHYNISTNGSQSFIVDNQTSSQGVPFDNTHYMEVYASLSCASVIAAFLATFIVLISGTYGGKVLYINMLRNVVHLPMRFFDTNPSGRILNRFSADITAIDQRLSSFIENLLRCVFYCLSAIVINAVVTPWFLLAAVPLAICYYLLQRFFRSTSRELQRLDSVTKSPIFSHFSESLAGLQTIRAFRAEKEFWRKAMHSIDTNITPFLFLQTINRWLGVRLDYMSCLLVFASAVASLSAGVTGNVEPAFIGLCITYALMISGQLNWIVRISAEVEMAMNSVERVLEYTDEPCEVQKHNRKEEKKESDYDESWPSRGMVEFHEVSLAYAEDLDPVLNNASFVIDPGEKIGVCGRTGSGKTSTVLSLFRVLNIVNGEIRIDNTDITRISLHHLRSRLAIIPQDPVLFSGTIRFNLDPEGILSDDRLWAALEAVQMKEFVQTLAEKLEAEVTEGGGNFSLGQRQLLCMARAIARNSRIVILDEATASIDHGTDNKLQEIVHGPEFEGRTVITIAHRISTIKQYDRVMVLDNGFLLEFASPNELLADPNSLFYSLANAGDTKNGAGPRSTD